MTEPTITDINDLRLPAQIMHAWAEGDSAAEEGQPHDHNPYIEDEPVLRDAWEAGYTCTPLPGLAGDEPTREIRVAGRHHVEALDLARLRTVPSLRAQCGSHGWTYSTPRHAADEIAAVA